MKNLILVLSLAFSALCFSMPWKVMTQDDINALPENEKKIGEMVLFAKENAKNAATYQEFKTILKTNNNFKPVIAGQIVTFVDEFKKFASEMLQSDDELTVLNKCKLAVFVEDKKVKEAFLKDNIIAYLKVNTVHDFYTTMVLNAVIKHIDELPAADAKEYLQKIKRVIYPRIENADWKKECVKIQLILDSLD